MKRSEIKKLYQEAGLSHEYRWVVEEAVRLNKPEEEFLNSVLRRRKTREPLAYILGHAAFWNGRLDVGPGVLIPRPETEELAEAVFQKIFEKPHLFKKWHLVDAGAGSGCIGLSIVRELMMQSVLPSSSIHLTLVESSPEAWPWLEKNVENLIAKFPSLKGSLHVERKTWQEWTPEFLVQALVSNPPYISASEDIGDEADDEVKQFEPSEALYPKDLALFEDASGPYRELLKFAETMLAPGGFASFELGLTQAAWIQDYVRDQCPTLRGEIVKDMALKDRFFNFERVS